MFLFNIGDFSLDITLLGNYEGSHLASSEKGIAIIVDVLRASTTIPVAMNNGIDDIYVAKEVEDTRIASRELDSLLMGERDCLMLSGFDYGNSPTEISQVKHFTKSAASFTSSTGAKRVIEAIGARKILIGSIINAYAVASHVIDYVSNENIDTKVVIVPAFTEGSIINFDLTEDQIGSLIIAREFEKKGVKLNKELRNEITYLENLLKKHTIVDLLTETKHGQKLVKLNFEHDIAYCANLNQINLIPISNNNIIRLSNNSQVVHLGINKRN
ncbi:MAG: 2-phosphosulfolactate phosphatase [Asgard group archaeon]|nr:2-phosphosulfolactate phosphatase [Asgard group archaeon]